MLTKAQTQDIAQRIASLRTLITEIVDGLRDHLATGGSREAQRVLRCAASDLDIAGSSLRLEADRQADLGSATTCVDGEPRRAACKRRRSIPTVTARQFQIQKYGGHGVDIALESFTSPGTDAVFWSESKNSFVIVADDEHGRWRTADGKRVALLSINGRGEIRWDVEYRNANESQGAIEHFELTEWSKK